MAGDLPLGMTQPRGLPSPAQIRWPLIASRDLFELQYGKSLVEAKRTPGPVPVYGTNGQCGSHNEALFKGPGVILGRKGQGPLGVEWSEADYWVIDTAYSLVPLRSDIDLRFAYFMIKYIGLNHLKDGTSNPTLSRDTFGAQALPLPPLNYQRAIAHILGTLDDRIELNRRMSETLEAMARALFRSWFVDFDPVRARAEGRDPGLPRHLADLFSARFVDSELGEIPEGWEVTSVEDEFNLTMGQSPPGETYNETGEGMPFYQGRADFETRFPKRRVYCSAPTRMAKKGDTLISVRAPVGDINMAAESCAIGRGVAAAHHKSGSRSYTFQFMRGLEDVFARFEAEGTVFGSISKKDFHNIPCIAPAPPVVGVFERLLAPLDSRIEILAHESRTLATVRDTLLPKLLSGELRLNNVKSSLMARQCDERPHHAIRVTND